jgi:hypothetical protein
MHFNLSLSTHTRLGLQVVAFLQVSRKEEEEEFVNSICYEVPLYLIEAKGHFQVRGPL